MNTSFLNGVNVQEESQNELSQLSVYKKLVSIRKNHEDLILWGSCEILIKKNLFMVKRELAKTGLLLLINFTDVEVSIVPEDFIANTKNCQILYHHSRHESSENHKTIKAKGFSIILYNSS